jgi:glycine cleavage system H protein
MKTYTESNEWVEKKGDIHRVGLSKSLVREIGDIVTIELPKEGTKLSSGDVACVLESTKAAIETYAPLSGKVVRVNKMIQTNPSLLNEDPEGSGWLYEIQKA